MEHTGFEPVASTMRMLRAPNCANTPRIVSSAVAVFLYADKSDLDSMIIAYV